MLGTAFAPFAAVRCSARGEITPRSQWLLRWLSIIGLEQPAASTVNDELLEQPAASTADDDLLEQLAASTVNDNLSEQLAARMESTISWSSGPLTG